MDQDEEEEMMILTIGDEGVKSRADPLMGAFLAALSTPSAPLPRPTKPSTNPPSSRSSSGKGRVESSMTASPGGGAEARGAPRVGEVVVSTEQAFEAAIGTASRLTTWTGAAVRRAIKQYQSSMPAPQPAKDPSPLPPEPMKSPRFESSEDEASLEASEWESVDEDALDKAGRSPGADVEQEETPVKPGATVGVEAPSSPSTVASKAHQTPPSAALGLSKADAGGPSTSSSVVWTEEVMEVVVSEAVNGGPESPPEVEVLEDESIRPKNLKEAAELAEAKGAVDEDDETLDSSVISSLAAEVRNGGSSGQWPGGDLSWEGELDLEDEEVLRERLRREQRDAETVTEEMRDEVMELLALFGVPYVVSPMEAEAQCAALEALGLVQGVVSDDSDSFLFGARSVYKNMFDERKYVETYLAADVEKELGLRRADLVSLALLLGSDYTDGVRGVGIVNATEIVHAFPAPVDGPPEEGLRRFKAWLDGFDPVKDLGRDKAGEAPTADPVEQFHRKHRNARNRWMVGERFPDPLIYRAYIQPQVNDSVEPFEWGEPDVEAIHLFAARKLGWPVEETDRVLKPMLQRAGQRDTQTRLDSFYTTYHDNTRFARIKSKRLRKAVSALIGREDSSSDDGGGGGAKGGAKPAPKRLRKTAAKAPKAAKGGKGKSVGAGKKKKPNGESEDEDDDELIISGSDEEGAEERAVTSPMDGEAA
jgi:5'-3' exonuclease